MFWLPFRAGARSFQDRDGIVLEFKYFTLRIVNFDIASKFRSGLRPDHTAAGWQRSLRMPSDWREREFSHYCLPAAPGCLLLQLSRAVLASLSPSYRFGSLEIVALWRQIFWLACSAMLQVGSRPGIRPFSRNDLIMRP